MKKKIIYWISLLTMLISCVTPFEPQGIESTSGLLVVEAKLLAPYGSEVKLSRTISLDGFTYEPVSGEVKIITDDDQEIQMTETKKGTYELQEEFVYRDNVKYALNIILGGKQYRSEYIEPLLTPEIGTLKWEYNEKQNRVDIAVSVENPNTDIAYYQWKYNENWEVRAPYFATHRWDPVLNDVVEMSLSGPDNLYFCWAKDSSRSLVLGSSEKLVSSFIQNNKILEIPYGVAKLNSLYHILVKQYSISKEAYSYFRNLQNNVEATGSLFAPQPTEIKGNISCLDNKEEVVVGFFVATTEVQADMYIESLDVPEMYVGQCVLGFPDDLLGHKDAFDKGYGILAIGDAFTPTQYALFKCVDCTKNGGSKEKPEWWPNNYQ